VRSFGRNWGGGPNISSWIAPVGALFDGRVVDSSIPSGADAAAAGDRDAAGVTSGVAGAVAAATGLGEAAWLTAVVGEAAGLALGVGEAAGLAPGAEHPRTTTATPIARTNLQWARIGQRIPGR
jgi:hypothetical protein